jgi:hypothetical protein
MTLLMGSDQDRITTTASEMLLPTPDDQVAIRLRHYLSPFAEEQTKFELLLQIDLQVLRFNTI